MIRKILSVFMLLLIVPILVLGFIFITFPRPFVGVKEDQNKLDTIICNLRGGSLVREGFRGWFCKKKFQDSGKACYSNKDCLSKKCVVGQGWSVSDDLKEKISFGQVSDEVYGNCSGDNRSPCFTGEITIEDTAGSLPRSLNYPQVCD